MQSFYPEHFERQMSCTEAEWLMWLPRAAGAHALVQSDQSATVTIGAGSLQMRWCSMDPLVLGLVRLPRVHVRFEFSGLDAAARHAFMKRFDLYTQRGGG